MSAFAFGRKLANDGYLGHGAVNAQRYSPQMAKREFSPSEREDIEAGQDRWMPTIFQNYGTPVSEMMASPLKQSLIAGVPAALLGAVAGHALGGKNPGLGAAIGGLGAGGVAGLARYFGQQNTNEGLEELMRRLPEGATKRDLLADPAYQADLDRRNELRAARMSYNGGGLRGKFANEEKQATEKQAVGSTTLLQLIGRGVRNSAVGRIARNPFVQGGAFIGGGMVAGDAAGKALNNAYKDQRDAAEYRRQIAAAPSPAAAESSSPTLAERLSANTRPLLDAVQTPVGSAGALGAMAGGLYGAFNPDVDENGRPKNRLRNALMGVAGGAGVGALGSMAAQHFFRPQNQLTIGYGPHQFSMTVPDSVNKALNSAAPQKAAASALEFGQKVAFINFNDSRVQSGLGGAALGAGIGGLAGLVSPGEDERGRKRNRFGAALAGALGGAGVGGLGAAAATHFMGDNPQLQQFGANIGSRLAGLFGNKAEAAPAAAADAAAPASRGPVPNVIRPLANKSVDQMIEERDALRFPAANDPMSFPEEPGGAMFIDTPSRTNALGPRALQPLGVDAAMAKEKQDVAMQRARQEAAARVSRQVPQDFRNQQQQMLQMQQNMLRGR